MEKNGEHAPAEMLVRSDGPRAGRERQARAALHLTMACLAVGCLAGCAAQDPTAPGPTASAQAQAVADEFASRANGAIDAGRTPEQALADAQLASRRGPGGFVTQPLSISGQGSSDSFQETVAVVNGAGVCYSFTLTLGTTHVTGSGVSVMDACPPSSS